MQARRVITAIMVRKAYLQCVLLLVMVTLLTGCGNQNKNNITIEGNKNKVIIYQDCE